MIELATVGGGCFWCIEAVLQRLKGVKSVTSGYAGGHVKNPSYREVCAETTGHAEVVQVEFDPEIISYHELISIFMLSHDPTTLNRQGADRGTQYRSIILYHSEEQQLIAEKVISEVASAYKDPIVTEIKPITEFYSAEYYHQDYFNNNPSAGYCHIVIDPKIAKLKARFASKLKDSIEK